MTLHANVTATLRAWRPRWPDQESLRQAFLGFLAARSDACQRSCEPGHITASAIVLDAAGERVLLTLHPRVGAWLQLGGHCEPSDDTLAGAARSIRLRWSACRTCVAAAGSLSPRLWGV